MIQMPENGRNIPSILMCTDGTVARNNRRWFETRRPEILGLFGDQEYERLPDMKDVEMKIRAADSRQGPNMVEGRVVHRTMEVETIRGENHFSFSLVIFIPVGMRQPVPAFVAICNCGTKDDDPARHLPSLFHPAEAIISKGYTCISFRTWEVALDYDEGLSTCFHELLPGYREDRPLDARGVITVWAWAASRIMDYFEADPLIDEKRVTVVGHSCGGKTALWCAVQDERLATAVSSHTGNSEDAIARGSKGERIKGIANQFPHWFCVNYQKYKGKEEELPSDQHMLLTLIVPGLVYTISRIFDSWVDPERRFEPCVQADPVYRLLDVPGIVKREVSLPEYPLHEGGIEHHHKTRNHGIDEYDWNCFVGFADRHMR